MSTLLRSQTLEELKTWKISRLGGRYLQAFRNSLDGKDLSKLEQVAEIINSRPFNERIGFYRAINTMIAFAQARGEYERELILRENRDDYQRRFL